jgi:hypothetical protein
MCRAADAKRLGAARINPNGLVEVRECALGVTFLKKERGAAIGQG